MKITLTDNWREIEYDGVPVMTAEKIARFLHTLAVILNRNETNIKETIKDFREVKE